MKTDAQLKADVALELQWNPTVDAGHVGVAARGGVVTLTGHVVKFADMHAIERAAQRVKGVRAVAVELVVRQAPGQVRRDADITKAAGSAFEWNVLIPAGRITIETENGWVSLGGEVDGDHQRRCAERVVRMLSGVVGVTSHITVKPLAPPDDIAERIHAALARRDIVGPGPIDVVVAGGTVTLRGTVGSWTERMAARSAAWCAPGIAIVVDELTIVSG